MRRPFAHAMVWLCLVVLGTAVAGVGTAQAQIFPGARRPATPGSAPSAASVNEKDPVAFTADEVQYDRENAIVTATGNVEAWQNDHILRADKITFDRNTNIAAATGHVVIIEPDGQVIFSDYAELTEGMREGVMKGMRAILAENGRLVANGARRTEGKINEMSRAVYTTCDLCQKDPTKPPLWQLRARTAVQDTENKTIEYRDAVLDFYGVPVAAFPYFWHSDPSQRRASGFLVPSFGASKHLGAFLETPYYLVLDDYSDATFRPNFNTENGFNLQTEYRRRFNDGRLTVDAGLGFLKGPQADVFAKGQFTLDDTWRYGFDIERATDIDYLRDYRVSNRGDVLSSRIYLEGFGVGSMTKLDMSAFQGVASSIDQAKLPFVLPRYQYNYFGMVDPLGGRLTFDTINFNVMRQEGTSDQRAAGVLAWQRPAKGLLGESYNLTVQAMGAAYNAWGLNQNPNFLSMSSNESARVQPTAAVKVNWPLVRDGGKWGTQLIEPIAQVVVSPGGTQPGNLRTPNEDSLDVFNFSDANLFDLSKFPGIDRLEGGVRANVGLHLNWTVDGKVLDGLIGQSFRTNADNIFPIGSGLEHKSSDVVARATFIPSQYFDFTGRARFDHRTWNVKFADVTAGGGVPALRMNVGYLYSAVNPYDYYNQSTIPSDFFVHRNEITASATTTYGHYKLTGYVRRDLQTGKGVSTGAHATYEDECFIFDVNFNKRYTSIGGDNGSTLVLFQITLKTVGQFGFHAF